MSRLILFILFTMLLSSIGFLWHDIIQSEEDPLYPAFPRWLAMVCPALGWFALIYIFWRYEIRRELRPMLLISVPLGLALGLATFAFVNLAGSLLLSLPILVPTVATTIYATTMLENRYEETAAIAVLFFIVFASLYIFAYTIVLIVSLVDPARLPLFAT